MYSHANQSVFTSVSEIADLGLATYQTWSKLTKEESRRKSHKGRSTGVRGAGTLNYMAPEHLESIHTASTERSDVYSFAIVVWVILTGEEPYASELPKYAHGPITHCNPKKSTVLNKSRLLTTKVSVISVLRCQE